MRFMLNRSNRRKSCFVIYLICTLALSLTGCGSESESEVISSELVRDEEAFGEDTAVYGDLIETKKYDAQQVYPISTVITTGKKDLIYDKVCVETNQTVKKGDLLVSIQPVTEEMLAKKEEAISKNKEEFETGKSNYKSQMESVQSQMGGASGTSLQILQIKLQKIQRQYDWYVENGEQVQNEMKAELEALKAIQGDVNIYAPYDGVIDSVASIGQGTELTSDRELLRMHSEEQVLLLVSQGSGLRYQMQVKISAGSGENQINYKGTVISADNVRIDELKDGSAYIRINEEVDAKILKNVTITANEVELNNVLIVKNFAVSSEKEKSFVTIVDGDTFKKRHVSVGKNADEKTWILYGVSEGQKVSIQ